MFEYCVSVLIMSFRRRSDVYFLRAGESALIKGLPFTILSLAVGWWGIPWGLFWTPAAIYKNLSGGIDVTANITRN